MKTVLYIRVSSEDQNTARQEAELTKWASKSGSTEIITIIEKVSGIVPASKRRLAEVFDMPDVKRLVVESIDRLGRNALDIQQTIQQLTDQSVSVCITSLGFETLLPDGRVNETVKLVLALLAAVAEMERNKMLERQAQGIVIAKQQGKYKGRKPGSKMTTEQILAKYPKVAKELERGESLRRTARLCSVSVSTVKKVKQAIN